MRFMLAAYAHCDQGKIDEVFYEQSIDYRDLESALRCMDNDAVANITPNILGKKPNTYTLTKALAEDVISRESENLPVCIVRPSMVIPAWKEPMPGWCTNMYGPTAFLVAYAKGALRSVIADEEIVADLIPVDLVINAVICALMKTAIDVSRSNRFAIGDDPKSVDVDFLEESSEATDGTLVTVRPRIPIYNVTTGNVNPLYIHKFVKLCQRWYHHYPLDPLRLPEVTVTSNKFLHKASLVLRQTIPAYLYDVTLMLRRHQGIKMSDLNEKLIAGMEVMEFFFTNQFRWGEDNARNLLKSISPVDQKVFNFDPRSFAWEEHIKHYVIGTRKYLVKESMDDYPRARKSVERLRILNRSVDSVTAVFLLGLFTASGATGYAVDAISYISGYVAGLL
ncbi:unnamed protein product [Clavelina lepadiformis]|uniref:Fatty acyl-CoA reductase n=1 Tax=Clavelina lepadiformis TaxID=159417 RepID=A0ABP0EY42_CLALP